MAVTINNGTETFTFNEGDALEVQSTKSAALDENALPASDSDDAFIIDFNGVMRTVMVTGIISLATSSRTSISTTTTIKQQIDWLETLPNGSQSGVTFNSTYLTSKTLYIRKFQHREISGQPNEIPFTLELVEGA